MSNILNKKKVLVLNKNWQPIKIIPLKRAITILYSTTTNGEPKARVVDSPQYNVYSWDSWSQLTVTQNYIDGTNKKFNIPEIIILSSYDKIHKTKTRFSKKEIFKRDNYTCLWCLRKLHQKEMSLDHLIPKSRNGTTSYENCVLLCISCNVKKANRTPNECGLNLVEPKKPKINLLQINDTTLDSWKNFI